MHWNINTFTICIHIYMHTYGIYCTYTIIMTISHTYKYKSANISLYCPLLSQKGTAKGSWKPPVTWRVCVQKPLLA